MLDWFGLNIRFLVDWGHKFFFLVKANFNLTDQRLLGRAFVFYTLNLSLARNICIIVKGNHFTVTFGPRLIKTICFIRKSAIGVGGGRAQGLITP